jgi:hypothetical protein
MGLPLPMSEKRGLRKCHDWEKLNPERVIVVNLMVCELRNATAAITPYKFAARRLSSLDEERRNVLN